MPPVGTMDGLFAAARSGDLEACMSFVDGGISVHIVDVHGDTPLHVACAGCVTRERAAADAGQEPDTASSSSATGGGGGHVDVAAYLMRCGASADVANHEGVTARSLAASSEELTWVLQLECMIASDSPGEAGELPVGGGAAEHEEAETAYEYLNRVIFPVLSPALNEVAERRPEDPFALLLSLVGKNAAEASAEDPAAPCTPTFAQHSRLSKGDRRTPTVSTRSLVRVNGLFPPSASSRTSTVAGGGGAPSALRPANATPSSLSALRAFHGSI